VYGKYFCLGVALAIATPAAATAQVANLQIRVIDGEGVVHAPGSRNLRPLSVEVTDDTGRPVEGAAVSFHVADDPGSGPGGTFANGLRTEVITTDVHGRVALHTLVVNHVPGRFEIRIIASKEQARAGTVSFQYIAGTGKGAGATAGGGHRALWLVLVAAGAAGAAAGVLASHSGSSPAAVLETSPPVLTIGAPSITLGKP
jgi:hypothetical protein